MCASLCFILIPGTVLGDFLGGGALPILALPHSYACVYLTSRKVQARCTILMLGMFMLLSRHL